MGRLVGWPSQLPKVPPGWLRLWTSPTSWSWTDRQCCPARLLSVAIEGWAHREMPVQVRVCPKQQPEPSPSGRPVRWVENSAFLYTCGVHALEGGCSVQWLFVYMQIFF